ncbi:hypothetical protein LAZ67_19000097 [Cordylochernes scorpioides]|uniref:Uncharacterized protein n=1 Tax=Cordylochernes scorpioides TaxID=51811 RepID=A0ABY6LJM4_9ARAC|nr:hypothetical protein LAZ67_19000097 [Cordylochernes scorpioides]
MANTHLIIYRFDKEGTSKPKVQSNTLTWFYSFGAIPISLNRLVFDHYNPGLIPALDTFFSDKKRKNAPMAPDSCKSPTPPASASNQMGLWHICKCKVQLLFTCVDMWYTYTKSSR